MPPRPGDRRARYGPDHPDVATGLNNLAQLLEATNRLAEAEPLYPSCPGDRRAELWPRPPQRRQTSTTWRSCCRPPNRLAEAEPLIRRVVQILVRFQHQTGHVHPSSQAVLANYDGILRAMGKAPEQIEQLLHKLIVPPRTQGF